MDVMSATAQNKNNQGENNDKIFYKKLTKKTKYYGGTAVSHDHSIRSSHAKPFRLMAKTDFNGRFIQKQ